jgi:hypothetical protein
VDDAIEVVEDPFVVGGHEDGASGIGGATKSGSTTTPMSTPRPAVGGTAATGRCRRP